MKVATETQDPAKLKIGDLLFLVNRNYLAKNRRPSVKVIRFNFRGSKEDNNICLMLIDKKAYTWNLPSNRYNLAKYDILLRI